MIIIYLSSNLNIYIYYMNEFILFFTILLIITIFWFHLEKKSTEVFFIKSDIDGKEYLVRKMNNSDNSNNSQAAADMLAEINKRNMALIEHMYKNRNNEDFLKKKEQIEFLKSNYNPNAISESSPNNQYTSYSINKGEKIVFCLRDKKPPYKLSDINTIMFVSIHELGHLMTHAVGHPPEFWKNMRSLLKEAIHNVKIPDSDQPIYIPQNFHEKQVQYCGMTITSTPCEHHDYKCTRVSHNHFKNYNIKI